MKSRPFDHSKEDMNEMKGIFFYDNYPNNFFKSIDRALGQFGLELMRLEDGSSDYWLQIIEKAI